MIVDKNIPDDDLIKILILEGNLRYFSILTERYENHILEKCRKYVQDKEVAADLSQEILIKIFLNLKKFKFESKFSTWLNSIINNTCVDHIRKHKKILNGLLTEAIIENFPDLVENEEISTDQISTEGVLELINKLDADEKMILLLKYNDHVAIKDIMKITGLHESAVKMRIKRAKEKLIKIYRNKAEI